MVDQGSALPGSSLPSTSSDTRDRLKGFDKFLYETSQSQNVISDLDKYLEEPMSIHSQAILLLDHYSLNQVNFPKVDGSDIGLYPGGV
ncbi:zinc finger BED domain-containing protein RICESLEEPER 1 [Prunus yedoensis var. nudiflora]|uniref:Zinc finger BED domain-containing protein RICESLEEPER 1 n=1 Tax=Prunus yedoensis var. nudiflora TaxID=2094558 RepID=A0A314ZFR9_PRUYE|nr:zinc finger BED domain-containing protein RICESLEEPER 1 [Prunus yedoensis var. nudiflora]